MKSGTEPGAAGARFWYDYRILYVSNYRGLLVKMCYVEIHSTPGFELNITPMYTVQQYIKIKCWWRPDFKIATLKVTFKLKYLLTVRESDPWLVVRW